MVGIRDPFWEGESGIMVSEAGLTACVRCMTLTLNGRSRLRGYALRSNVISWSLLRRGGVRSDST